MKALHRRKALRIERKPGLQPQQGEKAEEADAPENASTVSDNSSAFAGLNANTPWYNVTTAVAMFLGRFAHAIPILAIAGSLAVKQKVRPSPGAINLGRAQPRASNRTSSDSSDA